ncbi:MAG: hypothetical protein U5K37_05390 [Natrialbaceae archaeon]|nr:hypothetical protein [Natrialbaceae archaeon]
MITSARRIVLTVGLITLAGLAVGGMATSGAAQMDCAQPTSYPVQVTDATGTAVTVNDSPQTVVALQASDARTMYEIGAWDRVVGYPVGPATAGLPRGRSGRHLG